MSHQIRLLHAADVFVTDSDARAESRSEDSRWSALATAMARAVRKQCPAWLRDHAQDIAQAALTKVMAAERRGEGIRPLSPFYLYRVAHSALVDEIRHRKRRPEVPLEGVRAADDDARAFEPAGHDCLSCAKRERRLAVTLYLLGHTVPEAARILGWDAKRTENLVYRGLADLRQCLAGKGHKP
jgi:RNA polymerase sigma-70 factor (ECF subfamily)